MKRDFIIIGEGIAASSLAWQLSESKKNILFINENPKASFIEDCVINPITEGALSLPRVFNRKIKSLEKFYQSLKPYQKEILLEDKTIYQEATPYYLDNFEYFKNQLEASLNSFTLEYRAEPPLPEFTDKEGILINGKQINIFSTLQIIQKELLKREQFISQKIDLSEIIYEENLARIPSLGLEAKMIIFSQGWERIKESPFNYLPFTPFKIERLLCEFEKPLSRTDILFDNFGMLIPISETRAIFGLTMPLETLNLETSEELKKFLIGFLKLMLKVPFKVIDQQSDIVPSTKDKKTLFLGKHPILPSLFIFNVMGTLSLFNTPYASQIMKEYLCEGKKIPVSINIERFNKKN